MEKEISKVYDPKNVEEKWYKLWEAEGDFTPKLPSSKKSFSIVIPPPNVTGSLHMGHALNNTLQDIIIRFKRMNGYNVLWVPGTDHAGIATQNVVERELKKEGKRKEDIGREAFLKMVWEWKETYGGKIIEQLKKLGASLDWTRLRFTMDPGLSKAVRKEFVSLYKAGLIYRGKRIINWCPRCKTALSDIEAEHVETKGKLWYIKYPIEGMKEFVIVATTRPETMLGDTAVAVNPDDERYKHLIGKMLILPLVERKIPIIKDDFVDASFGTGAVKVTPAHDPNDFEIGARHNLPILNMMTPDGHIDVSSFDEAEKKRLTSYQGMERFKARDKIVADLNEQGLIEKIEDYATPLSHCYRCKTVVEPYLSDQWFVKVSELARPAISAAEKGDIKFVPEKWTKVYIDWMINLKDWCISRQIWWGHRIPVWYCKSKIQTSPPEADPPSAEKSKENPNEQNPNQCNEIIVSEEEPKSCPKCGGADLVQDEDVLDTWFSSALWPFSTLGWPEETEELKTFYPTSVLITAYDILTFWVSRMIMMGLKFMKQPPFQTVYIHGLIRDITGKKMSKSLGNVIDPLDLIDHAGADALRFALTSLVTGQGQDIKVSPDKITECRNFANKIWNVSRFILMAKTENSAAIDISNLEIEDKWILSRYNHTLLQVTSLIDEYDFGEAARSMYDFIWGEFCDWYIEMVKSRIYSEDKKVKEKAQSVLIHVLSGTLKLLHPFMPFITEEIWESMGNSKRLIISDWPKVDEKLIDKKTDSVMEKLMDSIRAIRNIRVEMGISPKKEAEVILVISDKTLREFFEGAKDHVRALCKAPSVKIEKELKTKPEGCATAVITGVEIYIPLKGLIDIGEETKRLKEELIKLDEEIKRAEGKLSNEQFVKRADPAAVDKEKARAEDYKNKKKVIMSQLESLTRL